MSKKVAITKVQAILAAVIIIVAAIGGILYYYSTLPTTLTMSLSEIRVGTVQHLSGPLASFVYGLMGIRMGVDWWNEQGGVNFKGHKIPVKLIYYDSESNKDYAIKLYEKLIVEDKVHILIAPWTPEFVIATAAVSERYKMVSVVPGGGSMVESQQGFKYVVEYPAGALYHFTNALKLIKEVDPAAKRVALITSSADPSGDLAKGARDACKEYGFEIVYDKIYPEDVSDASPMLREIAALNPDVLLGATFPRSCMLITSQLRDLRIYIKWICLDMQVTKPEFANAFGKWAVGFMQTTPTEPEAKWEATAAKEGKEFVGPTSDDLVKYWRALGGKGRILTAALMGAANAAIAIKMIEVAQSTNADDLIKAAISLDVYTCRGPFKLNPNNPADCLTSQHHTVMQWQREGSNLVYKVIYPPEFATSTVIPMPTWEEKETWPELTLAQ